MITMLLLHRRGSLTFPCPSEKRLALRCPHRSRRPGTPVRGGSDQKPMTRVRRFQESCYRLSEGGSRRTLSMQNRRTCQKIPSMCHRPWHGRCPTYRRPMERGDLADAAFCATGPASLVDGTCIDTSQSQAIVLTACASSRNLRTGRGAHPIPNSGSPWQERLYPRQSVESCDSFSAQGHGC
jgi:hypothetical protein